MKAYIEEGGNVVQSANKLFIHRNTMNYRLNKIKEIGNIDLDNGDEIFGLSMSIKILDYLESVNLLK